MAAEIIDDLEPINHEAEVIHELPTDSEARTPDELNQEFAQPRQETEEEDVPEKYRNKSPKEIIQMHQEAEKLLGKHSSEVGELRGIVDGFIRGQTQGLNKQQQQAPVEEEIDFFEDPERAVTKAIDNHPSVRQAAQSAEEYRKQTALATLRNKHPDMEQVLTDSKFQEWVKGSAVRQQMLVHANNNYDIDVASELLGLYKDRVGMAQQAEKVEQVARKQQLNAASTGNASGSASASSGKRIYRRTDIIKLMKTDPDRYEALSPEIMQAYAEGRVR